MRLPTTPTTTTTTTTTTVMTARSARNGVQAGGRAPEKLFVSTLPMEK